MPMKIFKALWTMLAVIVLAVALYGYNGKPDSDIGIFLIWSMLILAFPSSVIVALLLTGLSIVTEKLFSKTIPTSYWWIVVTWLCFFAAGYWQWFVLSRRLWRKWKMRRMANASSSS